MSKVCLGCGSILQAEDFKKPGYVLKEKMYDATYCMRCFRLKHYHELNLDSLSISNEDILKQAEANSCSVYYFVDLLNLSEEAISWFQRLLLPKTLVLTKYDYIPYTISLEKLVKQIRSIYHITEDILILSVKKKNSVLRFWNHVQKNEKKSVLFLGMTNVGKSSLLNMLSEIVNEEKCPVLVSEMPNTTLSFLEWKIGDRIIIDAPGFNYSYSWDSNLLIQSVPKKYLKPITIQMKKETILVFEGFLNICQNLEQNSITFYGADKLTLEKKYRIETNNLQNIVISVPKESDLVLPGIGFFYIKKSCVLNIFSSKEYIYEIRPSLFGGVHDSD